MAVRFFGWLARFRRPRSLGQRGEAVAAKYLQRLGYKVVARSDRAVLGELDLVAVDGRTIVFAEVKTRASSGAGHPAEAVDRDKQKRLTRLALAYLRRHELLEYPARFDVVAVTWARDERQPQVEHIRGAFEATGFGGLHS